MTQRGETGRRVKEATLSPLVTCLHLSSEEVRRGWGGGAKRKIHLSTDTVAAEIKISTRELA